MEKIMSCGETRRIRYVTKNDEGQILSMMELVKEDFAGYKEKNFLEAVYSAIRNNEAIVEEKDGRIAGLLMCSKKEKELSFLAVHPEYRKKGVAKRLIGKMTEWFTVGDIISVVTFHVETCVLLVRECTHDDEMISIKVNLQGIQLDQGEYKPEEKPIYGNIKKWIKEKYSMNASNLYIGQIKDKIGLEKCQNYNIGFGEGRVPNCPSEKEEAIMEAFKHFNLI